MLGFKLISVSKKGSWWYYIASHSLANIVSGIGLLPDITIHTIMLINETVLTYHELDP